MTYLPVEQSLLTHRKVQHLTRLLKRPRAAVVGHLVAMWLWALDNCDRSGALRTCDSWLLEQAALWHGTEGGFVAAACEAGFIEGEVALNSDGVALLRIHAWDEHQGRVLSAREAAAEKKRKQRARATDPEFVPVDVPGDEAGDVPGESRDKGQGQGQGQVGLDRKDKDRTAASVPSAFNLEGNASAIDEPARLLMRMPEWPQSEIQTRLLVGELVEMYPGADLAREVSAWGSHIQDNGAPQSYPGALRGWMKNARPANRGPQSPYVVTSESEWDKPVLDLAAGLVASMDMDRTLAGRVSGE
jgi:hypothetical protein